MAKITIGIDFSKEKFDVSVLRTKEMALIDHSEFKNNKSGYNCMLHWLSGLTKERHSSWLFCGENTGVYSYGLSSYLAEKNLFMWLEKPAQIHKCSGIRSEKTDKGDSIAIAEYVCRYMDQASRFAPPSKTIGVLKRLMSERQLYVDTRTALRNHLASMKVMQPYVSNDDDACQRIKDDIDMRNRNIKKVEDSIHDVIEADSEVKRNYYMATSIKGIGMCTAVAVITATENFTKCDDARRFSAYVGVVPRKYESGTSIHRRERTSGICNRSIRMLLTQAAQSAAMYNAEIRQYVMRKKAEGKPHNLIINNVRHKLLQRLFAVVKRGTPYVPDPQHLIAPNEMQDTKDYMN